ncbi:hypothetical protein SDC9_175174 [bioreactor metagenome]|uniref:Uncharacterized protein n=1 Tax=bioreactor metagenome TaxID=1076179 RepID=A0A645GNI0_9ZZZZ
MGLRKAAHIGWVYSRALAGDGFGHFMRLDHADDLDGHCVVLLGAWAAPLCS